MRVLIVDDQALNRQQLTSLVTAYGYESLSVESGEEALKVMPWFEPDVVLLDLLMPGMDGREVVPKLKAQSGEVHLPVIFITALEGDDKLSECLDAGGDDFLSKPFDEVILAAKLKAHLRTRELSQSIAEKNRKLAYHSSRMEQEHQIVQNIFHNALSQNFTGYPHLETWFAPLSTFNGDLFFTARGPLGNLYLLLGDITGHGLPAAIGTLPASQTFFAMTQRGAPIGQLAREMNKRFRQLLPEEMFCSAILLELSLSGKRLTYWNGGMPPAILLRDGESQQQLAAQHLPLGILEDDSFDSSVRSMAVKDHHQVLMYSDGVIEHGERYGQPLGLSGLIALAAEQDWQFSRMSALLEQRMAHTPPADDMSLVLLQCQPTGLTPVADDTERTLIPFRIEVPLGPLELRELDPINKVLRGLATIDGFSRHRSGLFTLLSEVCNNAVEHGLLGLNSELKNAPDGFENYYQERSRRLRELAPDRQLTITIEYQPTAAQLAICVTHNGTGYVQDLAAANPDLHKSSGRGLHLLQHMAEDIRWSADGRQLCFSYPLEK